MEQDLQKLLLDEVRRFFAPLEAAGQSSDTRKQLMEQLGWDPTLFPTDALDSLGIAFTAVQTAINGLEVSPDSLPEVLEMIDTIGNIIDSLHSLPADATTFLESLHPTPDTGDFVEDVLSLLVLQYLEERTPKLFAVLLILDVVRASEQPSTLVLNSSQQYLVRIPARRVRVDLQQLVDLLRDPVDALGKSYLPAAGSIQTTDEGREFSDRLFPRLIYLLAMFGVSSRYGLRDADQSAFASAADFERARRTLSIESRGGHVAADILVLPGAENGPGVEITPSGVLDYSRVLGSWKLDVEIGGNLPKIILKPDSMSIEGGGNLNAKASLSKLAPADDMPALLIGSRTGTRLQVGLLNLHAYLDSREEDYGFGFTATDCAFILQPSDSDGFLQKVLPKDGLRATFDLGMAWSRLYGFRISGALGIEIELPLNISIAGVIDLESLYVALRGESKLLTVALGLSAGLQLGPISASVQRIGLVTIYDFDETSSEEGFHFKFLPPTGAGLSINASGLVGGGFIEFDHPNQRYAGALALTFGEIGLTAIALITTKMPDGSKGFSLLVNIGVTFDPQFQLSMGFTLAGVGGLIGANRSMDIDVLRKGIKARTLDSILFPDPSTLIANVGRIISDLRSVFPPASGRFVIGPMVKIGYGTPPIVTADIGIFLELPNPIRIVLMGQVEAALPEEKDAIIVIHLDVLGVLDFAKKELSFQASLYNSSVLSFTIYGDSAFFVSWGHKPQFALSLGGFHPKFTPPPPPIVFADLKRLTISISSGSKFQLSCRAYQALTPNSFQFGARVDLYASAAGATLTGFLAFDALFYFSPFSFEAGISGRVKVKYKSVSLLEVQLELMFSGPTPWHAKGKVKFKILFVTVKIKASVTWGRKKKAFPPPMDAWPPFKNALNLAGNWSSVLPAHRSMVESLRSTEGETVEGNGPAPVVVHPSGRLEFRQNIVPLGISLQKIGNSPVKGHDRFDIVDMLANGETLNPVPALEFFARGQYQSLTKHQMLSVPAFEKMKSGVTTPESESVKKYGASEDKLLEYESILIREDRTSDPKPATGFFEWAEARFVVAATVARRAILRGGPGKRFSEARIQPKVEVSEETYCIVETSDMTRVDGTVLTSNQNMTRMAADEKLAALTEVEPGKANEFMVVSEFEVAA